MHAPARGGFALEKLDGPCDSAPRGLPYEVSPVGHLLLASLSKFQAGLEAVLLHQETHGLIKIRLVVRHSSTPSSSATEALVIMRAAVTASTRKSGRSAFTR